MLFKFFMKNPVLPCPYLVQKTSILSKEHNIMAKTVNRMPFLPISHEKKTALMSIFVNNMFILLKRRYSHVHILLKKRPFSQKHDALISLCICVIKNPLLSCPYWVKETSNLSKLSMGPKSQQDALFSHFSRILKTDSTF